MSVVRWERFPPPRVMPPAPGETGAHGVPTSDEVHYMLAHGAAAPSGGNFQPWKFRYANERLSCFMDPERTDYFTNYHQNETHIGLGAAVMNIELAAQAIGYRPELERFPGGGTAGSICDLAFRRGDSAADAGVLASAIPYRITSRPRSPRVPLPPEHRGALTEIASSHGAQLLCIEDGAALEEVGAIIGKLNQIGYLNQESHRGIMKMLRWTDEEAAATRDGIHINTFELSPLEVTGMRFLTSYHVLKYIRNIGAARALETMPISWARSASALCLLVLNEKASARTFFDAGRILEHLWLAATLRGHAFHVLGVNSYFDRLEHGGGEGFSLEERKTLQEVRTRYVQLFSIPSGACEAVLFRIVPPNPLVARTLRRDVTGLLSG